MAHKYNISEDGLELIKAYEGFRPVETVLLSGQKVIGYGHPYIRGEAALLTQMKAEEILKSDLEPIEKIINHIVFAPISQNQFDAMVSLAFNIGIDDFADSSVLHYLNNGQPLAAAAGFDEWRKSVIAEQAYVIDALVRRRTAEKSLFLSPESGVVAAPRYELPVLHDSTVNACEDDIEIFSESDVDTFVVQPPYEDEPAQGRRRENDPAEALMLSERRAAPQIHEDVLSANLVREADDLVREADNEVNMGSEGDSGENRIEDVVIGNVVEMKPKSESESKSESEVAVESELPQTEELSPIALAAADVSERLENLMEETKAEAEASKPVDESVEPKALQVAVVEPKIIRPEIIKPEIVETATEETEMSEPETVTSEITETETETETEIATEVEMKPNSEQSAVDVAPKANVKGVGAFWTTLVIGLILIAASLWQMKFSPIVNMGAMGEFFAPVVLLVGAMMIMGGMFYMIKAQLRSTAV